MKSITLFLAIIYHSLYMIINKEDKVGNNDSKNSIVLGISCIQQEYLYYHCQEGKIGLKSDLGRGASWNQSWRRASSAVILCKK